MHEAVVEIRELFGYGADAAVGDIATIDRSHVNDAHRGAREKDLFRPIELAAIDRAFDDLQAKLAFREVDDRAARAALQHVLRRIGRQQHAVLDQENILGRAFGDVAVV